MIDALILLVGIVGQWLLGIALAVGLLGSRTLRRQQSAGGVIARHAELIGLGIVLGIAATSYLQFLWSAAGGSFSRQLSLALSGLGLITGMAAWKRLHGNDHRNGNEQSLDADESSATRASAESVETPGQGALIRCCVAVIGLLYVVSLVETLLTPQRLYDERSIYGVKAKVLYHDRSIASRDLAEADFVQCHSRYPLLVPLAEQNIYALLGNTEDRWSKIVFPSLYLGMVLTFAGVLSRRIHPNHAWLFAAMLASTPALVPNEYAFLSGQADAPVACYHAIALLYLWDWFGAAGFGRRMDSQSARRLVLAAVAAAMAMFTKDEGIAFFLVDAVALGILAVVGAGRVQRPEGQQGLKGLFHRTELLRRICNAVPALLIFGLVPVVLLVPWMRHRSRLPMTSEMNYFERLTLAALVDDAGDLVYAVGHFLDHMFAQAIGGGLQWWVMLFLFACFPKRAFQPRQLLVLLDVVGTLAAIIIAGLIAPFPIEVHLDGARHLILIVPSALLFAAGQWGGSPTELADETAFVNDASDQAQQDQ